MPTGRLGSGDAHIANRPTGQGRDEGKAPVTLSGVPLFQRCGAEPSLPAARRSALLSSATGIFRVRSSTRPGAWTAAPCAAPRAGVAVSWVVARAQTLSTRHFSVMIRRADRTGGGLCRKMPRIVVPRENVRRSPFLASRPLLKQDSGTRHALCQSASRTPM